MCASPTPRRSTAEGLVGDHASQRACDFVRFEAARTRALDEGQPRAGRPSGPEIGSASGEPMGMHPLIELSEDREVRQAKGFRARAAELNGTDLEADYKAEVANAPRRHAESKKHLEQKNVRIPSGPQKGKDDRHLSLATAAFVAAGGPSPEMPNGDELTIIDALVPLRTAAPDKAKGDSDPNKGVDDIDLLGLLPDGRPAVVCVKYLAPDATRGGAGDTPLRALLRGLALAAIVDANKDEIGAEIEEKTGRTIDSEQAPALILAGAPRYWELCRKREAQKGAAWIREIERLGREISEQIGVEVFFVAWDLEGNPPWSYGENGPVLNEPFGFKAAWESGAGKLKPKPKAKKSAPTVEIIEADPSKPPRKYDMHESYDPGDTIEHPTLGTGVVQGVTGRGKISVRFGDEMKPLIHERP
jgi:hypothetical protein